MRLFSFFALLLFSACSFAASNLASGQTADIHCIDNKEECDNKAIRACPRGYAVVKNNPPVGTGIYYTDHTSSATAKQEMAYSMTVECK